MTKSSMANYEREKRSEMKILNLGCGTKTSISPNVVNIDWSIYLRLKKSILLKPLVPLFIRGTRMQKLRALPDNILTHNLAKGIPAASNSVDAVYHSHMLEHLDRDIAIEFLNEVKRVLKTGGIHRIVVPDFEHACREYLSHVDTCERNPHDIERHDSYVAALIEQSVRRESASTSRQTALRRAIENFVLGDARRRGETHQWMYDRINLREKLIKNGYQEVHVQDYKTSLIPNWMDYGLDLDERGHEYRPGSLYLEARK